MLTQPFGKETTERSSETDVESKRREDALWLSWDDLDLDLLFEAWLKYGDVAPSSEGP